MSDRPALGVQDAGLQGHVNNSLHRSSDGVPRRTPRPRLVVPGLVLPGVGACRRDYCIACGPFRSIGPASGSTPSRRATSWRSEEHTSELQSLMRISYAVFCLKKKQTHHSDTTLRM